VKHQAFVSLVLYVRNEGNTVAPFLREIDRVLDDTFEFHEIIVVDDASTDDTGEAAAEVARELSGSITILELARPHRVEAGIIAGLERAVGDFVFELESSRVDFELGLLREMFDLASTGIDIVGAGSQQESRRSKRFYRILNRFSNLGVELATERIRLVSRRALNAMLALKEKVRYRKALYALTGFPHRRLTYRPAESGRTTDRPLSRETAWLALDILLSFSSFGLRVAHILSLIFASFSILVILYTIGAYLFLEEVAAGWTTLMIVVSLGLAGLFLMLGIIGEYLARILVEVRGRPLYALRSAKVFHPAPTTLEVSSATDAELLQSPSFIKSQLEEASEPPGTGKGTRQHPVRGGSDGGRPSAQ
jgi:dolichol-phosphate mannosyltransferase